MSYGQWAVNFADLNVRLAHLQMLSAVCFLAASTFLLITTLRNMKAMSTATDALKNAEANLLAAVQAEKTEVESLKAYINGVPEMVQAAVTQAMANAKAANPDLDDATLTDMADEINTAAAAIQSDNADLAAAVTANTAPADANASSASTSAAAPADTSTAAADASAAPAETEVDPAPEAEVEPEVEAPAEDDSALQPGVDSGLVDAPALGDVTDSDDLVTGQSTVAGSAGDDSVDGGAGNDTVVGGGDAAI